MRGVWRKYTTEYNMGSTDLKRGKTSCKSKIKTKT